MSGGFFSSTQSEVVVIDDASAASSKPSCSSVSITTPASSSSVRTSVPTAIIPAAPVTFATSVLVYLCFAAAVSRTTIFLLEKLSNAPS